MLNKFLLIFLLLPLPAFAGPLDILDATGDFDGRFGHTYADGLNTSEVAFDMTQGVRFVCAPWIEPYLGFAKDQQLNIINTEWVSMGVRNKTFLPPFTFAVEYRSVIEPSDSSSPNMIVGYVSISKDWNLKKTLDSDK